MSFPRTTARRRRVAWATAAVFYASALLQTVPAGDAEAKVSPLYTISQSIKKANMLVVLDTSGSMTGVPGGTFASSTEVGVDCDDGVDCRGGGTPGACAAQPGVICTQDLDCRGGNCAISGEVCTGSAQCPGVPAHCNDDVSASCINDADCTGRPGTCSTSGDPCGPSTTCPSVGHCEIGATVCSNPGGDCMAVSGTCSLGGGTCDSAGTACPANRGTCLLTPATQCTVGVDCTAVPGTCQSPPAPAGTTCMTSATCPGGSGGCAVGGAACTDVSTCTPAKVGVCRLDNRTACSADADCPTAASLQGKCAYGGAACTQDSDCTAQAPLWCSLTKVTCATEGAACASVGCSMSCPVLGHCGFRPEVSCTADTDCAIKMCSDPGDANDWIWRECTDDTDCVTGLTSVRHGNPGTYGTNGSGDETSCRSYTGTGALDTSATHCVLAATCSAGSCSDGTNTLDRCTRPANKCELLAGTCASSGAACTGNTCPNTGSTCSLDGSACSGTCANVRTCSISGATCTGTGAGTCGSVCSSSGASCSGSCPTLTTSCSQFPSITCTSTSMPTGCPSYVWRSAGQRNRNCDTTTCGCSVSSGTYGACTAYRGYCSGNRSYACNATSDCTSQGGGTCNLGTTGPATAPNRCSTGANHWACLSDSDCPGFGYSCTSTAHSQTWTADTCPSGAQTCNAQTCGGTCSVDGVACTGTCANVARCSGDNAVCTGAGAGTCANVAHCSLTGSYCASAGTCASVGHCSLTATECDASHACGTASYCTLDTTVECDATHACPTVQTCSLTTTTDCDATHGCPTASYCVLDTTTECDASHACSNMGHCSLSTNNCNASHTCGTASYCNLDTTTECDASHACPAVSYCNTFTTDECDATHACANYAHCSLATATNCNASHTCPTASYCNLDTTTECDATHPCPNIGHCATLGGDCDATHACVNKNKTCSVTTANCDATACAQYIKRCASRRNKNCDPTQSEYAACGGSEGSCTAYTGYCSGNDAYACNSNADCTGQGGGTCTTGPLGTAPNRCSGSGNHSYACEVDGDCTVASTTCNTGATHLQTWTAQTCGGGVADTCGSLTFSQTCNTGTTHAQTCGALTLTQSCVTGTTHAQACNTGTTHTQACGALTFAQSCVTGTTHTQSCSGASHSQTCVTGTTHAQTCSALTFSQTCSGSYAQTCTVGATTQTCGGATPQTCAGGTPQACTPTGANTCLGGSLQACTGATAGVCNAATTNSCVAGTNVCSVGTNHCVAAANDCSTASSYCVPSTLGDTCVVPFPTDTCVFAGPAQPTQPLRMCQLAMTRCSTDANCTAIAGDSCGPSTSRTVIAKRALKRVVLENYNLVNFGLMTFYESGYFPYYKGSGTTSKTIVEFQPREKLAAVGCWSASAGPSATCTINSVSYTLRGTDNSRYETYLGSGNYLYEDQSWNPSGTPACAEYCDVTAGRGRYDGSYYQYTISTGTYSGSPSVQTAYTGKTRSISGSTYVYYNARPDYYNGGPAPPLSFENCSTACSATCGGRWDTQLAPFLDPAASAATAATNAVTMTQAFDKASYGGVVTYFGTPTGCTLHNSAAAASRSNSAYHYMHDVKSGNVGAGVPADTLACRDNFVLLITDGEANGPGDQVSGNSCTSAACNSVNYTDATFNAACSCRSIKASWEMYHDMRVKTFVVGFGGDVATGGSVGLTINNNIARAGGTTAALTATNEAQLLTALNKAIFTAVAGNYSTSPASAGQGVQQTTGCSGGLSQCIQFGNYILDARVNFPDWSGVFTKYNLDTSGNVSSTVEASARLKTRDWRTRQIYTSDLSTTPPTTIKVLIDPSTGVINNAAKLYSLGLGTNATEAARIAAWLLGDSRQANPVTLGAIINSTPIDVGPPGQSPMPGGPQFFTAQAARKNLIYVGADDGMLHAFYASDPDGAGTLREMDEAFAYLPPDLLPTLTQIYADGGQPALPADHIYGLASSPKAKNICTAGCDAYNASTTTWKTVLVMGEGYGGNDLFALDITSPFDSGGALVVDGSPSSTGAVTTAPLGLLWHSKKVQSSGSNYDATIGRAISVPAFYYNKTTSKDDYRLIFASGYKTGTGTTEGRTVVNARLSDGTFLDSDPVNGNGSCTQEFTLLTDIPTAKNYAQPSPGTTEEGKLLAAYPADTHGRIWRYNPATSALAQVVDLGCQQPLHFAPAVVQMDRDNYLNHAGEVYLAAVTNSPLDADTTGFSNSQIAVYAETVNQTDGTVTAKTTFGSNGLLTLATGPSGQICAVQAADGTCTTKMPATARPLGTPSAVLKSTGTSFVILVSWYVPPADTACGKGQSYLTVHEFLLDGSAPATQKGGIALGSEPVTNPVFVGGSLYQVTGSSGATQITSGLGASFTPGTTPLPGVASQAFRNLGWIEKDN